MELGLRLAGFPYVVLYYDASPWAQTFSIPSIAHGLKQPASLAAGVVYQSPDDPMVSTGWRDLQASKPAKPLELAHGSATQSQRRERPSVPSPPPCFLVSRLAGTPNLAWYCTDFVDLDPTERALVRHPGTAQHTPTLTRLSCPSPPLFDSSSVLHTSLSLEHRPDSRSPALLPAHPPPTVESAR
ncbi:hypothetical protein CEP54_008083 [Fusarium duplospermum]|uniref:Uncharacterized protein n=1 Tax=Fusarium duplospermum TaxID=1325734 RepID=A0A428PXT8_9HYPO|nr:hypothetical protein CEP54_008083 [Fusarium duplospermum]